jgi:CRP/FNR family transcriptional regulator
MIKTRESQDVSCKKCPSRSLCLAPGLTPEELSKLNTQIAKILIVNKKDHVFFARDSMPNLYAVYRGSCKEYWIDENGNECITNFYFPGDIIGMESVSNRKHAFSVSALEDSELCIIPVDPFFALMQEHGNIMKRYINITSFKMQNDQSTSMGITANERVCDFLMNILTRMQERNHSEKNIYLPMSQLDISNFLGIAYETVNRVFQNLKRNKIIKINNKTMAVLDVNELENRGRIDYSLKNQ